jgi:hypothetical protein
MLDRREVKQEIPALLGDHRRVWMINMGYGKTPVLLGVEKDKQKDRQEGERQCS